MSEKNRDSKIQGEGDYESARRPFSAPSVVPKRSAIR
jgi:hypothetical protein